MNKRSGVKATARSRRSEGGASLIKTIIVVAVALAATATTVVAFQPAFKDAPIDAAMCDAMPAQIRAVNVFRTPGCPPSPEIAQSGRAQSGNL